MATTTKNGRKSNAIELERIPSETIIVPIRGTTPLIMHRFSEKARKKMGDLFDGNKKPKQPRTPEEDFQGCLYKFEDGGYGFPAIGFKAATVSAGRFYDNVTMTGLRQFMFFHGEVGMDGQQLVRIEGEPRPREDVVRNAKGGTDLRTRAEFPQWSADIRLTYVTSQLTRNAVVSLIDAAGLGVGVGDWRVERRGDFGCFEVDDKNREIEVIG